MQFNLLLAALAFGAFTLTRVVLLFYTGTIDIPLALWPSVITKGLFFDTATLAFVLSPMLMASALLPLAVRKTRWYFYFRALLITLAILLLLFLGVAELIFWTEFHTRFNFIALDYLIYTNEVVKNIWQSYPIVWIFTGLGVVSGLLAWVLIKRFLKKPPHSYSWKLRLGMLTLALLCPLISFELVNIEMMYQQGNAFAEEISGNGLFTLAAAARPGGRRTRTGLPARRPCRRRAAILGFASSQA